MIRVHYTFAFVVAVFACGCNQNGGPDSAASSSAATESPNAEASTANKTADDLRTYLQENIDRYLGGQNTTEQLNKLTIHFMVVAQANQTGIDDIKILSVLQAYSDSGEKESNHFIAKLSFSKGSWQREETIHYFYKNDSWKSI